MPILTPEERVGEMLAGKYLLERILAAGGMATIFVGVHEWTQRAVAVKILNYEYARHEEVVRRFLQEARAASQLKHPNVVDVLDMGKAEDGTVYLVMELLEGETLKGRMRRAGMTLDEIVSFVLPMMSAVAFAHRKGVVHRDLKPDNIFLACDEEGRIVPKLLDFGIAKIASGDSSSTRTGTMVGTPQYMSPEQARGDRDVGPPADVWSMGVVIYACLAGRVPFHADSPAAVLAKVLVETPPPLRHVAPRAPAPIAEVVDKALQRDPSLRYAHMGEMLVAFERAVARSKQPDVAAGPVIDVAGAATVVRPTDAPPPGTTPPPTPPTTTTNADGTIVEPERSGSPSSAAALAPQTTPFAWTPDGAPQRPAPVPWLPALAAIAMASLAVILGAVWWISAGPAREPVVTQLAAPGPPAPATPSPVSAVPVRATTVDPPAAPPIPDPEPALAAPVIAAPEIPPPAPIAAVEPAPQIARPAAPARPTPPPDTSRPRAIAVGAATPPRAATRRTDDDEPATTPPRRDRPATTLPTPPRSEPRRGTGGALILH